jgi:hypothetical protein
MMAAVEGLSRADRFVRTTNRILLSYAGAFALYQLADIAREAASGTARSMLLAVSLAAWATWTVLLVVSTARNRAAKKDPALRAAFEDERANLVRLRAYRFAFWATIASAAVLGVPGAAHLVAALTATKLVVVVGVTSFIVAFVVLDGE